MQPLQRIQLEESVALRRFTVRHLGLALFALETSQVLTDVVRRELWLDSAAALMLARGRGTPRCGVLVRGTVAGRFRTVTPSPAYRPQVLEFQIEPIYKPETSTYS